MRAAVIRRYGAPDVFAVQDLPDPQPKPGEVLIRVKTIGVNFADILQRIGAYPSAPKPPFVPGLEVAGVVEKVADGGRAGEGDALRPGDAVAALTRFGAYAEWVTVPAGMAFRLPAGMPFDDAAAIPVNYLTAYHSLFTMGNMLPGDRLLIHAAAGGVGIAAVQLAKARGLKIFGVAGPTKQETLRKLGVDHAIDYDRDDFVDVVRKYAPDGVEMAMDPIGGKSFAKSFECLGSTGRLVIYGFSTIASGNRKRSLFGGAKALLETPRFHPLRLMGKNVSVIGVNLSGLQARPQLMRAQMAEIFQMYSAGKIKPIIGKKFPLLEAAMAHQFIHDRKNIGKVVLWVK
ncbi:MAG TPA: zinc-binding dehydrogenase [Candidatus Acidoferrum sp.]|nr:zinc-binding dehydrogenase [Candidatus Acidoferrum sp.]